MRVTTEIKNYIHDKIYAKAKPRLDEYQEMRDAIVKKYMDRYNKFCDKAKVEVEAINKRLAATAKRLGLTMKYENCNFVSARNINTNCFNEVYTSCYLGYTKWEYNTEVDAVDKMIAKLEKDIEHQISGVVFKLEAGAKKDEIESMLSAIEF